MSLRETNRIDGEPVSLLGVVGNKLVFALTLTGSSTWATLPASQQAWAQTQIDATAKEVSAALAASGLK